MLSTFNAHHYIAPRKQEKRSEHENYFSLLPFHFSAHNCHSRMLWREPIVVELYEKKVSSIQLEDKKLCVIDCLMKTLK